MNLRPTVSLTLAALAAAALAACASHPPPPPAPVGPPPQAEEQGPPPSGQPAPYGTTRSGPIPGSVQDFVINVGELVYFDFNASDIRPDAQPVLAGQAQWLQRYPQVRVRIEGNCDERSTLQIQFRLGARRCTDAVRCFLIAHGVPAGRIATVSYGKESAVVPGHDDQAWARNRNDHTAITEGAR